MTGSDTHRFDWTWGGGGTDLSAWLVSGVGVAVLIATVGEWAGIVVFGGAVVLRSFLVQASFNFLPGLGLVFAGFWLRGSELSADRYDRIAAWCLSGLALSTAANVAIIAAFPPDPIGLAVGWARTAAVFGAVSGLGVGIVEARAIRRSLAAERARVRAEDAERQRERLDYLNGLLRHEVLNAVNVIVGHAAYLIDNDEVDDATAERLEAVRRQGDRMSRVITDVRVLIDETRDGADLEPVELIGVLETELSVLRDRNAAVEIETDVPDRATVLADDLVGRVFANLLRNAVEHNDGDAAHVSVAVERTPDAVVVEVADDGPGIPPSERAVMFERETGQHYGIGLYLVGTLVERYDGSIELSETGEDGTTFTVELPRSPGDVPGETASADPANTVA